ncbi:MAG: PD-(D/E)XK nuclease family protein [Bifidobacteriaceae bacterium]|jgi:putative RecB family exonuclease|nr:PD-(D/E)XK nuclease family protein [Bifidobacteriaceae bacterium]
MAVTTLSPSRASDFMRCPLLYRYRAIDRLEEAPSEAAMRGRLVHSVLEALFDLPPQGRTPEAAEELVGPAYQALRQADQRLDQLFGDGRLTPEVFLGQARDLVGAYFQLEDPRRLAPQSRELLIEAPLEDGPLLRGYVDRLDVAPGSGLIRIVDYKTGKSPAPRYQGEMLFQLRFYALIWLLARGQIPAQILLLYLGNRDKVADVPSDGDLARTRLRIETVWREIQRMAAARDFPPVKGPLCPWCSFQALCPLFGGQAPPFPENTSRITATGESAPE